MAAWLTLQKKKDEMRETHRTLACYHESKCLLVQGILSATETSLFCDRLALYEFVNQYGRRETICLMVLNCTFMTWIEKRSML